PAWLTGDPALAYRLTQGLNAIAMSLGAVVVYAIARELSLRAWTAVAVAAVALASPDLVYVGYDTADALGYPLALLAVFVALRAIDRPSAKSQAVFIVAAALATFARVQYAALFIAAPVAAAVVERGRVACILRRHALLVAAPLAGAAAASAFGLGRY